MARVFLSYSREDAASAQKLAEAVGNAGHEVWWDRHLHGGSQFVSEIDQALANAEAVVVLWSKTSIRSAWVQDEAVEGRDTGRLVPVILDSSKPPLGFRQFQSVDLSDWNGAREPAALPELLRAIAKNAGETESGAEAAPEPKPPAQQHKLTICVLPFINVSGDAEQEYFSDGITEDIITDLSKISALSVVSRHTAVSFKGSDSDIRTLARQLNVTHVLEGSVRKAGSRVRITAQLTDGAAGDHVWAERYDRELTDIFAIQDEIAHAIVAALKLRLLAEEKQAISDHGTSSIEAYDLYLMARDYWVSGNDGDPRRDEVILRLCRTALEIDPQYARAWALMALTQSLMKFRSRDIEETGIAAAEKALLYDPDLAEPHCVKAAFFSHLGRFEEANSEIEIALALDPDSWEVNREAGAVMYAQRRMRDAIPYYEKATALIDTDCRSAGFLMTCLRSIGESDAAREAARVTVERAEQVLTQDRSNGAALAWGSAALAELGEVERAREWIRRALLIDPDNKIMRYNLACTFGALDEADPALDLLDQWFETATVAELRHAEVDPDLDPVREHPRFSEMMTAAKETRSGAGGIQ